MEAGWGSVLGSLAEVSSSSSTHDTTPPSSSKTYSPSASSRADEFKSIGQGGDGRDENQSKRRAKQLLHQKISRQSLTDKVRHLTTLQHTDTIPEPVVSSSQSASRPKRKREVVEKKPPVYTNSKISCIDFDTVREEKEAKKLARRQRKEDEEKEKYSAHLMLWEELRDIPFDLTTKWRVVPLPANTKRCIVISAKGVTTARLETGELCCRFPSALPGGSAEKGSHNSPGQYCVLDCMFDANSYTFYAFDLLCWRAHMYYDCDTVFRTYWLATKLSEQDGIGNINKTHPYRFVQLPAYNADSAGIAAAASPTADVRFGYRRDSLLFMHQDAFYTFGVSTLACHLPVDSAPRLLELLALQTHLPFEGLAAPTFSA